MQKRTKKQELEDRKQKFIKLCAKGENPYQACIKAGYSLSYAKSFSHVLWEKYKKNVDELRIPAQQEVAEEVKYSVQDSYKKLCEIQKLALLQNDRGNFTNLSAAIKAEELIGKMFGHYQADNEQKQSTFEVFVNREKVDAESND